MKLLKDHLNVEQMILNTIYSTSPVTKGMSIEEIAEKISTPRTTVVENLNALKKDGLIKEEKEGRTYQYSGIPELRKNFQEALSALTSAYIYALDQIRRKELKELEEAKKELKG